MTLPAGFRDRLAASIQLQLSHRGLGGTVGDARAIADRALQDAQVEALSGYVAAVEAGGDVTDARAVLAGDPVTNELLVSLP